MKPEAALHLASGQHAASIDALLDLAATSDIFPQVWWSDTVTGTTWLGLGCADERSPASDEAGASALALPDACQSRLRALGGPVADIRQLRYFGGIPFDPADAPHPLWRDGGTGRFVLPAILLRHRRGQPLVNAHYLFPDGAEGCTAMDAWVRSALVRLRGAYTRTDARIPIQLTPEPRSDDRGAWERTMAGALRCIEQGLVRKVVVSRELSYASPHGDLEPWAIVRALQTAQPHRVVFCFRFGPDAAFLGATPERLALVEDRSIRCDCLAGTAPRGATDDPIDDAQRAVALLASDKDLREHRYVRDGILDALRPHAVWLETAARPEVLYLAKLLHLESPVRGFLKSGLALGDVLRSLHPTPAVGGSPRDAAVPLIRELEGRPRGWYAGPIGWVSESATDMAVAIRSAVVRRDAMVVTGGAGIVAGSDPAAEWDETARKAGSLVSTVTGQGTSR